MLVDDVCGANNALVVCVVLGIVDDVCYDVCDFQNVLMMCLVLITR